jgi:outer membrane lipoprotein carrier protein
VNFSTNTRKIFIFAFLVALSCLSARAEPLSPDEVKTLLARVREKRATTPNLQADFQERRKVHLLDEPIATSGKVWFQAPNKFRRENKGNAPSVTVSDGQQLWIYYPKFKSAERYSLAKRSPLDAGVTALTAGLSLQNLESNYHVTGSKEGDHVILELQPRVPSLRRLLQRLEITLDSDLHVVQTRMLQPNGDEIVTTYANHGHAPLPANVFEFTPPAGTDITTPLGK